MAKETDANTQKINHLTEEWVAIKTETQTAVYLQTGETQLDLLIRMWRKVHLNISGWSTNRRKPLCSVR